MGCSTADPVDMTVAIGGASEGGVDQMVFSADGLSNPVELHISCENLIELDTFSKSDPMAIVYLRNSITGNLDLIGRTEAIENSKNPKFVQSIVMKYCFEERQSVHIKVLDIDDRNQLQNISAHDLIGTVDFVLADGIRAPNQTWKASLVHPSRRNNGTISINFEEHKNKLSSDIVKLVIEGEISSRNNNFFRISRQKENSLEFIPVFQSESAIFTGNKARWRPVKIGAAALMRDDPSYPLRLEIFAYGSNGNHRRLGSFDHTFATLSDGSAKFSASGVELRILSVELQHRASFMDYLFGGMNIALSVAIDFTASNGDPRTNRSLHYLHGASNQY